MPKALRCGSAAVGTDRYAPCAPVCSALKIGLFGSQLVLDREVLHAADEPRMQARNRTRQLDLLDSRDQVFVGDLHLEPRQMSAEAEMFPDPEADMSIRLSIDAELEGCLEDFLVAIRRGIEESHGITLANQLVPERIVAGRGAAEVSEVKS